MGNYAVINTSTGLVENVVVWDGGEEWSAPDGCEAIETDVAGIGWRYADGEFSPPVLPPAPAPTPEQILASNTAVRDVLLAQATVEIAPLQDAVDLDDATTEEAALLKIWKQFRVAVSRIDLTQARPAWPSQP